MILGMEIAMLIFGIYALIAGKMNMGKNKVVLGLPARLIGLIGLVPLPLSLLVGVVFGIIWAAQNRPMDGTFLGIATGIEVAIVLSCFALMMGLGYLMAGPPPEVDRVRRYDELEEEEEEEYDRPRKKKRPVRDDDGDESISQKPLPRRRVRAVDDDEEEGDTERPKSKRRARTEEDDDDDRPKKRR